MMPFCVEWFLDSRFLPAADHRNGGRLPASSSVRVMEDRGKWLDDVGCWIEMTEAFENYQQCEIVWAESSVAGCCRSCFCRSIMIHRQLRDMIVLVVVVVAMPLGSGTCLPIWFGWIGWENLQESPVFHGKKMKKHGFSTIFPQKSNWYVQVGVVMCNSCTFAVDPMF